MKYGGFHLFDIYKFDDGYGFGLLIIEYNDYDAGLFSLEWGKVKTKCSIFWIKIL